MIIRTHNTLMHEKNVLRAYLEYLENKKKLLKNKATKKTHNLTDNAPTSSKYNYDDKIAEYIDDIDNINKIIRETKDRIYLLDKYITYTSNEAKCLLQDANMAIEFFIYKCIVIDGLKVTEAVEKTAKHFYIDVSTVWRKYKYSAKKYIENTKVKYALFSI